MAGQFGGFAKLGSALTGGGQLPAALAEAQGTQLGANTENAIAEAQARQQKTEALKNIGNVTPDLAAATQDPTKLGAVLAAFAQAGVNPETFAQSVGVNQHNNSYNQIVNPETSDEIVSRHLVAEGKPGIIHQGAQGEYTNALHPGVPQVTPLGQSLAEGNLALKKAQTSYYNSGAGLKDAQAEQPGGGKGPTPFQWKLDENGQPVIDATGRRVATFTPGGPQDPEASKPMSDTTRRFFGSAVNAATGGIAELENIMRLPAGANKGVFGIGASPGHGILDTPIAALKNAVSTEDSQLYNARINNLSRYIATAENSGRMPPSGAVQAVEGMALQPNDKEGTRLTKLAQGRQAFESALDSWLNTMPLNETSRAYVEGLKARMAKAIPFTVADVDKMLQSQNPQETIGHQAAAHLAPAAPAVGTVEDGHRFKGGNPADPASWELVQ